MHNPSNAIEQLIERARAGEATAVAELRGRLDPDLRRAIEREDEHFTSRLAAPHCLDEALNQSWKQFSDFKGETAKEIKSWLRVTVLKQQAISLPDSVETIAPASRDRETIAPSPQAHDPSPQAQDPSPQAHDPSPQAHTEPNRPEAPAASPQPPDADSSHESAGDAAATVPPRSEPPPPASDPFETVPPTAVTTPGDDRPPSDPLLTVPPAAETTHGDPLATMADGGRAQPASEPVLEVFGDYEILKTIAKGGMGVVYKARHSKLRRIVALKMILSGKSANQDDIERFFIEAEAAAQLEHKNIVGIHEVGEVDGQHYISMQYVEGQSLDDMIGDQLLAPKVAARYIAAISEAMQYAHDKGVLHRDLKPANIMVDRKGVPLVTDFGLAKLNPNAAGGEQGRASQSLKTMAGAPMGTPSYMPPEQARGKLEEISELSDVYSLGATLYDLLTGKPPFGAADVFETMEQVKKAEPVAPRVLNASVPKDLETICLKCLQKPPARRYQSAQELADELQRYLAGEPIHARPVGLVERTIRWCYRNPWPTTAICASVCGLVVATVLWQFAVTARDQAKASRSQLLVAINKLFTTWGNNKLLNEPALVDVRAELLRSATELYEDIGQHLGDDPELQQELGVSYYRLGDMMFHMEGYREADKAVESALGIQQVDDLNATTDEGRLHELGESLTLRGSIKVKLSHREPDVDKRLGLLDEAESLYKDAIKVRQRLVGLVASELEYKRQLWNVKMNLGLVSQWKGVGHEQRGRERQDDAEYKKMLHHYLKAEELFKEVQAERTLSLETDPETASLRRDSAEGSYNLAYITMALGDYASADEHIGNTFDDFEVVLKVGGDELQTQYDLARSHRLAGQIASSWLLVDSARQTELYVKAVQHFAKALLTFENLDEISPAIVTRYRLAIADVHRLIDDLHMLMEETQAPLEAYQAGVDVLKPLVDSNPESTQLGEFLAEARLNLQKRQQAETAEPASTTPEPVSPQPRAAEAPPT